MKPRCVKVADHLSLEDGVESFDSLYLDYGRFCDDEVQGIVTNDMVLVVDRDADLTLECHALIDHLDGERFFVRALAEARAQSPMHLDRTLDDLFSDVGRAIHASRLVQPVGRARAASNVVQIVARANRRGDFCHWTFRAAMQNLPILRTLAALFLRALRGSAARNSGRHFSGPSAPPWRISQCLRGSVATSSPCLRGETIWPL